MTAVAENDVSHRTGKKVRSLTRLVESDADLLSAQLKELRLRAFPPSSMKELRKFSSGEAAKLIGVTDAYIRHLSLARALFFLPQERRRRVTGGGYRRR